MNVFIFNLKKSLLSIICIVFIICLILFSNSNIKAAQEGLTLWATAVVPSLFPFFIATELLYYTNFVHVLDKFCSKFMKKIFNLSGNAIFPIIMGIISGYPTGAKIISNLRKDKQISKIEGEHLLTFTNNSGPLFILGTVGISIFGSFKVGLILIITHILAAFSVGFLYRFWKPNRKFLFIKKEFNSYSTDDIGTILINSISKSINTILNIGGFIVLFSIIISILENSGSFHIIALFFENFGIQKNSTISFLSGIFEITNGIKKLSIIGVKNINSLIVISSFLLGFGGLSVLLQVYSCISKTDLSIKPYIVGKILHGFFSVFYTIIILYVFNINIF